MNANQKCLQDRFRKFKQQKKKTRELINIDQKIVKKTILRKLLKIGNRIETKTMKISMKFKDNNKIQIKQFLSEISEIHFLNTDG
jgi:hypothetical protein